MKPYICFERCDRRHAGGTLALLVVSVLARKSDLECVATVVVVFIDLYLIAILLMLAIRADAVFHLRRPAPKDAAALAAWTASRGSARKTADGITHALPNRLGSLAVTACLIGAVVLAFSCLYGPVKDSPQRWNQVYDSFLLTTTVEVPANLPSGSGSIVCWQLITSLLLFLVIVPVVVSSVYGTLEDDGKP